MNKKKCIIVGAGEYSAKDWELMNRICKKNTNDYNSQNIETLMIAADGGYEVFKNKGIVPDIWIGDFDSYNRDDNDVTKELIQLSKEKDDTDMLAAIRIGLERECNEFHILGGTGKRVEHTIANIQCLGFLCGHNARGFMYGENRVFTVIKNETIKIEKMTSDYMSIFAQTEVATGVSLQGFKFPLENASLKKDFPIGISNEFEKSNGQICVKNGELLLIF